MTRIAVALTLLMCCAHLHGQDTVNRRSGLGVSLGVVAGAHVAAGAVPAAGLLPALVLYERGGRVTNTLGAEVSWIRPGGTHTETERVTVIRYSLETMLGPSHRRSVPVVGGEIGRIFVRGQENGWALGMFFGERRSLTSRWEIVSQVIGRVSSAEVNSVLFHSALRARL